MIVIIQWIRSKGPEKLQARYESLYNNIELLRRRLKHSLQYKYKERICLPGEHVANFTELGRNAVSALVHESLLCRNVRLDAQKFV